jgi:hypothetical protein
MLCEKALYILPGKHVYSKTAIASAGQGQFSCVLLKVSVARSRCCKSQIFDRRRETFGFCHFSVYLVSGQSATLPSVFAFALDAMEHIIDFPWFTKNIHAMLALTTATVFFVLLGLARSPGKEPGTALQTAPMI